MKKSGICKEDRNRNREAVLQKIQAGNAASHTSKKGPNQKRDISLEENVSQKLKPASATWVA